MSSEPPDRDRSGPALEVRGVSKSFGNVTALDDVSLSVSAGEVVGLIGDNGAGKSTLVKCLSGRHQPDAGTIRIHGSDVTFGSPDDARRYGVETVHQGLELVETLDVATNLFLNREPVRDLPLLRTIGWVDKKRMYAQSRTILDQLRIRIDSVRQPVSALSGGQRQAIAVGRAVEWGRDIVLMDEPEAALGVEQAAHVLGLVERLRASGVAVLLISHNMQHVIDICDRAAVLRHGRKVAEVAIADVDPRDLVDLITGAADAPRSVGDHG